MLRQGFFPAGPMDHFAFRAANLLAGNPESAAGLEVTLGQFGLRFETYATIAFSGSEAEVTVDGERIPLWVSHRVRSGTELRIGIAQGPGFRLYVAISGGIDVPPLFGSRATYTMGALGGLDGRALQAGDRLPLGEEDEEAASSPTGSGGRGRAAGSPAAIRPTSSTTAIRLGRSTSTAICRSSSARTARPPADSSWPGRWFTPACGRSDSSGRLATGSASGRSRSRKPWTSGASSATGLPTRAWRTSRDGRAHDQVPLSRDVLPPAQPRGRPVRGRGR